MAEHSIKLESKIASRQSDIDALKAEVDTLAAQHAALGKELETKRFRLVKMQHRLAALGEILEEEKSAKSQ